MRGRRGRNEAAGMRVMRMVMVMEEMMMTKTY